MKAADFALLLLTRAEKDSMPPHRKIAIIAVAAGLHTPADVARWTNKNRDATARAMADLKKLGYLLLADKKTSHYFLTPCGKAWVEEFLSFVKH